jgi:hypothetical protein
MSPPATGSWTMLLPLCRTDLQERQLALNDAPLHDRFYNRTRRHSQLGGMSPEQLDVAQKQR